MAGFILIADRDVTYAQSLADRILHYFPSCRTALATDDQTLLCRLRDAPEPPVLIITEAHFQIDRLSEDVRLVISLQTRRGSSGTDHEDTPYRLGSVKPILRRLEQAGLAGVQMESRDGADHLAAVNETGHEQSPLSMMSIDRGSPRVILMMTQTTSGRDSRYADERCRGLSESGVLIHYLPLMPNYYCSQWRPAEPGHGSSLTDLLLRIGTGGITIADLGAFESADRLGRLQFRPTERADDMMQAPPEDLYRLCFLLRERTLLESGSVLVMETAGLAFCQIRPILALCDQIEVISPVEDLFPDHVLRREISDVLADLPSICQVIHVQGRTASACSETGT